MTLTKALEKLRQNMSSVLVTLTQKLKELITIINK